MFPILLVSLALAACGGSSPEATPSPDPTTSPEQPREVTATPEDGIPLAELPYRLALKETRDLVAVDAEYACQPSVRAEFAEMVAGDDPEMDTAAVEVAFIDACKEAGQLGDFVEFSEYYPGP
jgi:hypothetical protein